MQKQLRSFVLEEFRFNRRRALDNFSTEVKEAVSEAFNRLLKTEMTFFIGSSEGNKRNGFREREYVLKGVGAIQIRYPLDRKNKFESVIIPKNEQIDLRLKEDLAVLHLSGISTRTMAMISSRILGVEVSATTVSDSLDLISDKALLWLERPLVKNYWALYIDGTNFSVVRRGSSEKEPSLVVVGVDDDNHRSILAIEPGTKDNVKCWEATFNSLIKRGLNSGNIRIGVMDGLPGLENLFSKTFPNSVTQRCWKHALGNAIAKCPKRLESPFKKLAHKVMYAESENDARVAFKNLKDTMETDAERAIRCLEKDLDSLLVHYRFEKSLWRSLRTSNAVERVHKEFKRRTKIMEGLGERTLKCIVAFTALRLEMGWQKDPMNAPHIEQLVEGKRNRIEGAVNALFH
ncbi:MAG: IS256 family transposase [Bdellovibrionales bacterium]|nr:IS256 family transposase [Bdellovibrionales bacterium]